jgi:hypothetical protein
MKNSWKAAQEALKLYPLVQGTFHKAIHATYKMEGKPCMQTSHYYQYMQVYYLLNFSFFQINNWRYVNYFQYCGIVNSIFNC